MEKMYMLKKNKRAKNGINFLVKSVALKMEPFSIFFSDLRYTCIYFHLANLHYKHYDNAYKLTGFR